ncbi:MAG TPA: RibD family protein, partial [Spirochaetota bacterium]|nr:RibD family protein [Spirochaetota bacterium]
ARQVMRPFFTLMQMKRPHVIYKTAMTADGFTATKRGDSKWISSSMSRLVVHRLRTLVDAIIVGRGAFESDNPSLTSRLRDFTDDEILLKNESPELSGSDNIVLRYILGNGYEHTDKSPLRVLAGLPGDITGNENLFRDDNYIVFAEENKINYRNVAIRGMLERDKIIICDSGNDFTDEMMAELKSRGIMWAMLEGGGETAGRMVDIIDEYLAFVAPRILGGGRGVMCGRESTLISDSYPLDEISTAILGNDIMYHGYRRRTCSPVL